jgi:hypothetical protein
MGSMSAIQDNSDRYDPYNDNEPGLDGEFKRVKAMVIAGARHRAKWIKEAERAFDYVANHQWSEEDTAILVEQSRPAVTFNRTAPIIKAVCGLEVNNRQGIVFLPRTERNNGPDEVRTAACKWVRDECNAEDEESEAFRDNSICGEGWIETRMEFDEEPTGKIIEERIDPMEMGVNNGAGKANYSDARLMYRVRDLDYYDAKDMFPGVSKEAIHAKWMSLSITPDDGGQGNKTDYPNETRQGVAAMGAALQRCRVVHAQWWERTKTYMVAQDGVDDIQHLSEEDFGTFQDRAQQAGIQYDHAVAPKKVYYEAFLGADGFLPMEDGQQKRELDTGMFQWRAMTGERDRKDKCFYGLLRDMFDPQMWANKWLSQTMQILNANAKGGIMAETDAFANQRKAEEDWSNPTKIIWTKPGSLSGGKIKERTALPLPQGLSDLMQFALASLRDTTGVNLELLGQADREQAASLEMQRRQSAMTILATLFDSLRRFRKGQGRLLLHYINKLPDGTLIRVTEQGYVKYIPLVREQNNVSYDVIVDEAPSSPNQKQAVWVMVTQLLQTGIKLSPQTVITLLKYSPLPESVVQEIAESMGMGQQMSPDMMKQKLDQAEQALQVMEKELTDAMGRAKDAEDQKAIDVMKLEIDEYKAETLRLQAQWQNMVNTQQALADALATPNPHEEATGAGGAAPGGAPGGGGDIVAIKQQVDKLTQIVQQLMAAAQQAAAQEGPEAPAAQAMQPPAPEPAPM